MAALKCWKNGGGVGCNKGAGANCNMLQLTPMYLLEVTEGFVFVSDRMRTYKKKTERGTTYSQEIIDDAVDRVRNGNSIRSVAKDLQICHVTLSRYVKKSETDGKLASVGYSKRPVFSKDQADGLVEYLKHASKIYFGLSPKEVRKLAFECAVAYGIDFPESWRKNQCAGEDWLTNFLKVNKDLSIRTPEATSLQRAINFNKTNVSAFFDKLGEVRDRYGFTTANIWNLDETGVTTVQRVGKVVAQKGTKQVGGITSSERGVLVTLCVAVSAIGNSIPPMFVFPRKRYQDHFIRDGPPGSIGTGNGSGWMTSDEFYKFMEHFVLNVRPSKEQPVLLLLDNHESHLAVRTIDFAKEHGVVMLSFPPHCSHRLQPLDRSVYGPFKKYLSTAQDAWLRNNPGKSMTIYDVPGLAREALPLAVSPVNVTKGFKVTGIEPYNREIFSEDEFLPSSVTDQPEPVSSSELPNQDCNLLLPEVQIAGTSSFNETDATMQESSATCSAIPEAGSSSICATPSTSFEVKKTTPEAVRPLPKSVPRKTSTRGRKKRKSAVLTDTPEKNALEEEQKKRKATKSDKVKKQKVKAATRKILQDSDGSSEEDECFCLVCTEPYSQSKPREKWVMCMQCKLWSHLACTEGSYPYVCHNCASDSE